MADDELFRGDSKLHNNIKTGKQTHTDKPN